MTVFLFFLRNEKDRLTIRQTIKPKDKQTDRQTNKETDRLKRKSIYNGKRLSQRQSQWPSQEIERESLLRSIRWKREFGAGKKEVGVGGGGRSVEVEGRRGKK